MVLHVSPTVPLLDAGFPLPLDVPFTLAQAVAAGVSDYRLRVLEHEGLVRRIVKGVYVAAQTPDGMLLRARALALVVPHRAVVVDETAWWFWTGLLPSGSHKGVPPLQVFHRHRHSRLRNRLCDSGSRMFLPSDVVRLEGLIISTPLRTALDLGRLLHRDRAIGALDSLLRLGVFSREELLESVERFKGMRGVRQLRPLAPLADGRSESPGESTLRLRWLDISSLPPPEPQISIMVDGVEVYRVDLGVRELRYGCEYDGEEFHHDKETDRRRREDLRRRFGWDVEGVGKLDLKGPTEDVQRILHEGIRRARRRAGLAPSWEP
jgi:putative AbiEi antitoxin of type IV toxin-antitoxin system